MKLISVNIGFPREVTWKGKIVSTGIFKEPVRDRVILRSLNLDGDGRADLAVHGGLEKAVYVYSFEHYAYWRSELPDAELTLGSFGENFTTTGLREEELNIGDRFASGTVLLTVTQPRLPCYKLGLRFGRPDMVKRFGVAELEYEWIVLISIGRVLHLDASIKFIPSISNAELRWLWQPPSLLLLD